MKLSTVLLFLGHSLSGAATESCASFNTGSSFSSGITQLGDVVFILKCSLDFKALGLARAHATDMRLPFYKVT